MVTPAGRRHRLAADASGGRSIDDQGVTDPAPGSDLRSFLRNHLGQTKAEPLHARLQDGLAQAIREQLIGPGRHLPAERDLAAALGVSRATLRRALDGLHDEGHLKRHQGARTVVVARLEKAVSQLTGFSDDMRARGREPGARWLARAVGPPSPAEALALGLSARDRVVRLERVRTADGEAVAIERAAVPQAILPSPDLVADSLYDALGALGARPVRGTQRMRALAASPTEARILGCEPMTSLFCVERRCFAASGVCVELTETRYLGSAYDFVTDLNDERANQ